MSIKVELPSGTVAEFPDGTPPDVINAAVRAHTSTRRSASPKETSHALGAQKGARKPLANAGRWLQEGLEGIGLGLPGITKTPDQQDAAYQAKLDAYAAKGVVPSKIGEAVGEYAATLPVAALPGGPLVQGAVAGALTTDERDPAGVAKDAVIGAVSDKLASKTVEGVVSAISTRVAPVKQMLVDARLKLTPDPIAGERWQALEDKLTSIPQRRGVADTARARSVKSFNPKAIDRGPEPADTGFPQKIDLGKVGAAFAEQVISDKYEQLLQELAAKAGKRWSVGSQKFEQAARTLTPDMARQFSRVIHDQLFKRLSKEGSIAAHADTRKHAETLDGRSAGTHGR